MNDEIQKLFEDGFASISLGAYKLREAGNYQDAYDELGHVIYLFMEDRQELRKTGKVEF